MRVRCMGRFTVKNDDVVYLAKKILENITQIKLSKTDINHLKKLSTFIKGDDIPCSYLKICKNILDDKLPSDVRSKIIESNKKRRQYQKKNNNKKEGEKISIKINTKKRLKGLKGLKQFKKDDKKMSFDYVLNMLMDRSNELTDLKKKLKKNE